MGSGVRTAWLLAPLAVSMALITATSFLANGRYSPQPPQRAQAGDKLKLLVVSPVKAGQGPLLVALRAGCHYCEQGDPFLQKLGRLSGSGTLKVGAVVISSDLSIIARTYLRPSGIERSTIRQRMSRRIGVRGTPAILPADSDAQLRNKWIERLKSREQDDLVRAIAT